MTDTPTVTRTAISTPLAPPPAGSYSQAILAAGTLYISGQTPRRADGRRCGDEPFAIQTQLVLDNLEAIASAAGTSLANAAFVTVYLRDPATQAGEFDTVYRDFLQPSQPFPARAIVQSDLPHGDLEVTAVIPHSTGTT